MLNYDEVDTLAERACEADQYNSSEMLPHERVFVLLVDVADRYMSQLEELTASDASPAPFFAGTTPLEAMLGGIADYMEMKRDGTVEQYR